MYMKADNSGRSAATSADRIPAVSTMGISMWRFLLARSLTTMAKSGVTWVIPSVRSRYAIKFSQTASITVSCTSALGLWGKAAVRRDDKWTDVGRLGDATEIVGLSVYNGSFYGGSIPRAEVFRFDGPNKWTSVGRLFDPPDFELVPVGSHETAVQYWSRASSLTVYQGKLFSSTATCY
jgi:hypothetical protein